MPGQNNGPEKTFIAGATILQWELVYVDSSGYVQKTDGTNANDKSVVGVAQEGAASGAQVKVRMINAVASAKMLVAGAYTAGNKLFTGANGKATTTTTSQSVVGVLLEDSAADGDVVEVACMPQTHDAVDAT